MVNKATLHGLVLSGGESRRMGRDKGLIQKESVAWVNRAGELLRSRGLPVSVMIREQQRAKYGEVVYPDFELVQDQDLVVGGPLKGLLSFHRYYPDKDVLVLPCDMPYITDKILQNLIDFYQSNPTNDVWVFEEGARVQPFPGIYAGAYLSEVTKQLQEATSSRPCLMDVVKGGRTATHKPVGTNPSVFLNANYPKDI